MITLFDGIGHESLKPLTFTKPVANIRIGILTIKEKWERHLNTESRVRTKDYLAAKFDSFELGGSTGISASVLPTKQLAEAINSLGKKELLMKDDLVIAINILPESAANYDRILMDYKVVEFEDEISVLTQPADIFRLNGQEIENDFELIKDTCTPQDINSSNRHIGEQILVEEGAKVNFCILNATDGPIYIAKGAEIMEGAIIRGPFAILDGGVVKIGAKIYGPTTIGPHCKVGGEINNCVFQAYSNKGHDGFLGNSVIGEWCNLGADTNSSNLKNNYGNVKIWSYKEEQALDSEMQFCGLIMGDHSKSGINTMFNTGTVVGVSANIFGGDFPPKFIPSFAWGGASGFETFDLDKSYEVSEKMMERRKVEFTEEDKKIQARIFEDSDKYRNW